MDQKITIVAHRETEEVTYHPPYEYLSHEVVEREGSQMKRNHLYE